MVSREEPDVPLPIGACDRLLCKACGCITTKRLLEQYPYGYGAQLVTVRIWKCLEHVDAVTPRNGM